MAIEVVSSYHAPRWLPGGNVQTIYAALFRHAGSAPDRRERWDTPDGDFIDVDWIDGPADAPLLLLFHGLEGGARSHYARAVMAAVRARGWRMLLPHFRGCGGEPNRMPRAYHSGDSAEAAWILQRAKARAGTAAFYATGVSLGANVLLKWLGEQREAAHAVIDAAVAVSAPLDLNAVGDALEHGFNRIYMRMFLASLVAKSLVMLERFPQLFDQRALRAAHSLRQFDDVVTAPLHGFADATDYWTRSSSKPLIKTICVPTLILNARNDPFLPERFLPTAQEASAAVTLEFPATGGHVGFVSGRFPGHLDWLPARIIEFLTQASDHGSNSR